MLDIERELRDPTTDARVAKEMAQLMDEDIKKISTNLYPTAALCGKRIHSGGLEELIMVYHDMAALLGKSSCLLSLLRCCRLTFATISLPQILILRHCSPLN